MYIITPEGTELLRNYESGELRMPASAYKLLKLSEEASLGSNAATSQLYGLTSMPSNSSILNSLVRKGAVVETEEDYSFSGPFSERYSPTALGNYLRLSRDRGML